MLTIRLSRVGTTKRPFYRVVVMESHAPRDGRFVESLGHYNPRTEPETVHVDHERVAHWIGKGARPSDTVRTLLARHPAPPPSELEAPSAAGDEAPAAGGDAPAAGDGPSAAGDAVTA